MLIPLGILAASGAAAVGPAYELISTTLISSNTPSVTFNVSSFASTYKHLQIRCVIRSSYTTYDRSDLAIRLNGDTGANYAYHTLAGLGTSVGSGAGSSQTFMYPAGISSNTQVSGNFSPAVIDFLDAYSSTKNTTMRSLNGRAGTTPYAGLYSGFWNNTASVSSILLYDLNGANFMPGSRFSLYGIKG